MVTNEFEKLTAAIDEFAEEMKAKVHAKMSDGVKGWDGDEFFDTGTYAAMLMRCVYRLLGGDTAQAVDVANLAMFIAGHHKRRPPGGTCVLCGCTDAKACRGGCGWYDDAHTICTRCFGKLLKQRASASSAS